MKPNNTPTEALAADIAPGQAFYFASSNYVRATEDQVDKHPARDLRDKWSLAVEDGSHIVLIYMLTYRNKREIKTPASIVSTEQVWVRNQGGKS